MNFTPQQQHSLLTKMGYDGPVNPRMMEAFLSSNPGAAAKMGKFSRAMQKGFAEGGSVTDPITQAYQDILGRTPEQGGFDYYTGQLNEGKSIEDIRREIQNSPEANVRGAYQDFLGRAPEQEGLDYWMGQYDPQNPEAFLEQFKKSSAPELQQRVEQKYEGVENLDQIIQQDIDTAKTELDKKLAVLTEVQKTGNQKAIEEAQKAAQEAQTTLETLRARQATSGPTTRELSDRALNTPESFVTEPTVNQIAVTPEQLVAEGTGVPTGEITDTSVSTVGAAETVTAPEGTPASTMTATTSGEAVGEALEGVERPYKQVDPSEAGFTPPPAGSMTTMALETYYNPTTGESVTTPSGGWTAPEGFVKGTPPDTFIKGGLEAVQGEVSTQVQAQATDPTALAQLGLSAPQIEIAQQIEEVPDLQLTPEQLAQAATLASTGLELPQAVAQVTGQEFSAVAAKFTGETPEAIAQDEYKLTPTQTAEIKKTEVEEAAKASEIPTAEAAQTQFESTIEAAQGTVGANELVNAKDILETEKAVTAIAATMEGLDEAAKAIAAQGTFSQTQLAKAAQGEVTPKMTVQGQMKKLMEQFNDGTPAWAAGGIRAANAAMAARGLGGSSMAGAAIVQAAMEAAIPIAQQDAQAFFNMGLQNLNNRQSVALANAAAVQNMEIANLNNRQQAALQNSNNSFALQTQNLSNEQAVVLANAQFKAALQETSLGITTQVALKNAARYAESNNINLSNSQQALIERSSQNLEVNLANLSNEQQSALANLQVRASIIGQELSNEQQMAVLESTQAFEAAGIDANNQQRAFIQDAASQAALEGKALDARQQTALFNVSNQLREREIELTNEQQTRLFNTTNSMTVELENLSNKQATALANAQIDAAIKGQELSNIQQTNVVNAARISEIANINFTADQQKALENAKLAQTVDLANLDASSAKLLADAAAMSNMDMANLNNRQQAQVENARNMLQMDLTNVNNQQQTAIFKSQQMINSILSDQAAENAAKQFNAASENQVNQFYDNLVFEANRFSAQQTNAINQFNAGEENANEKFMATLREQREQFISNNMLIVAQANAKWRQDTATMDTAAQNEANMEAARTANALTTAQLDKIWQRERDLMSFAFTASESGLDRELQILMADRQEDLAKWQQRKQEDNAKSYVLTKLASDVLFGSGDGDGGLLGGLFG